MLRWLKIATHYYLCCHVIYTELKVILDSIMVSEKLHSM